MEKTGREVRRLGGDNQRATQESRSRNFAAPIRCRPNLQGQTSRSLLGSPGTILNRPGTWSRRRIRPGVGGNRVSRGRKLLLQTEPAQTVAASVHRRSQGCSHSRLSPDGTTKCRRETQRRSLHLAPEIATRLGNRTPVRQRFCELRLVRCPNELHQLR